uniref:RNA-directed DNA polymerase, eukaryota, nucleotide-binding alpha-beta plait domain protein n=1 Tax=Tanacetum cinerariifolium TaxID=118510 RepID=A0A699HXX2_TANCI|nr:RNA-directed DNA polymerase, eukaryota, nucleotide-binding alpha-beta plait domain protein [Tanacetum cinerariifolium]
MQRFSLNDMVHNHYLAEAKKKTEKHSRNSEHSLMPYTRSQSKTNGNVDNVVDTNASPCKSIRSNTRIAKEAGNVDGNLYTDNMSCGFKLKEGGSILDILDEMIKVGQTMGFSMVGCTKDMEGIIGAQGENVVF